MSIYLDVLAKIKSAAQSAGRSDLPELVAVSKFQPLEKIISLHEEGQKIFGENYVQELIEKKEKLNELGISDISFHFIGGLQRNKVKLLLPHVETIHSVDSFRLLEEINEQASKLGKKIKIYLQLNLDREDSKGGFVEEELLELSQNVVGYSFIQSLGFMAIPDPEKNTEIAFQSIQSLSKKYEVRVGPGLSIGMSQDFELAIQYGATSVRIGSALFGARCS